MLELARYVNASAENVRLILADALQDAQIHADCVVLNMVLHLLFGQLTRAASLLQPGGSLLVTELCSHNQSWAREACGDLWLVLNRTIWPVGPPLRDSFPGKPLCSLRNGFQIQVRHFSGRLATLTIGKFRKTSR
jgi:ArsR family transcriptional regulator